jgi:hypothetical protein
MFMMAGTIMKGIGEYYDQRMRSELATTDALMERQYATLQAKRILAATERQRGAARAATAASGARIDQFSLVSETDIVEAGETDAAMSILSGEMAGRGLERKSRAHRRAATDAAATTLFNAYGQTSGWKGAKGPTSSGDSAMTYSRTGADIHARR